MLGLAAGYWRKHSRMMHFVLKYVNCTILSNDHIVISVSKLCRHSISINQTVHHITQFDIIYDISDVSSCHQSIKITRSDAVDDSKEGIAVPPARSKVVHLNAKLLAHLRQ